jgi:hypothetical protein
MDFEIIDLEDWWEIRGSKWFEFNDTDQSIYYISLDFEIMRSRDILGAFIVIFWYFDSDIIDIIMSIIKSIDDENGIRGFQGSGIILSQYLFS